MFLKSSKEGRYCASYGHIGYEQDGWIIAGRNQQLFLMRADCVMYNIFDLQRVAKTRKKQAAIFNSQLGLTMGDGYVPVYKKDK
jgi:hypothetical protein